MVLFRSGAEEQPVQTSDLTLVSSDSRSMLRISCIDGNSLFISFAVPAGKITPEILNASGAADMRWITGGPAGRPVNIVYAATPRALLRSMMADKTGKMTFTPGGAAFDTRTLTSRLSGLPSGCR